LLFALALSRSALARGIFGEEWHIMDGVKATFFSICILGIFLLAGKLLRVRIKLLQTLFLPSSIIGGFAALALGPHGVDVIPRWVIGQWSQYPGLLINVVFACLFLGVALPRPKMIWALGGAQLCFGGIVGMGQYFFGLLAVVLVLGPLFGTPAIFACILEVGFAGGHGTAAGMQPVFEKLGFEAGGALGQMSATVGIITAVVVGIILVNIAIRRGYCACLNEEKGIPSFKRIGLIPSHKRFSIATATVATEAVEPMAFHFSIVGIAVLIGWLMLAGLQLVSPVMDSFPLFPLAMIGGMLVQVAGTPLGVARYFDRDTFDRILGFCLDVLVVSAIASLRLDLFLEHVVPFAVLMVVGISWCVFVVGISWCVFATLVLAPRMFPKYWFERGVTEFGMQTGVTAMGLLLLRLVDPQYKTGTANAFGFKQMVYEPFLGGGFITATSPLIIFHLGVWKSIGLCAAIMVVLFIVSQLNGWTRWRRPQRKFDAEDSTASGAVAGVAG
jgi:ESS family glutamate:Na+ symporter